jgi:predicted RNA-binding Zn-ribbon protein involved in translation (DUF1610 family)
MAEGEIVISSRNDIYCYEWDGSVWRIRGDNQSKHRCPNCGATKITTDNCEYCGT